MTEKELTLNRIERDIALQSALLSSPSLIIQKQAQAKLERLKRQKMELMAESMVKNVKEREHVADN